ncbi:hypothetical protein EJ03DRAFT_243788, partial [Teratosphaeria nubilosa]
ERSPSAPLSSRRIISRIASPFANKSRGRPDFSIEIDDPHRHYSPGETLTGSVKLRVTKATRVTHIAVYLHGYVQVYKNPGSSPEGYRGNSAYLGPGKGSRGGEYFGNGFASLFEDESILCGDGRLAEGSYQFNFELDFPDRNLPSSIDFERGSVTYMITAAMTRPSTMSPVTTCERKVYFMERIDISTLYPAKPRHVVLEPITKRSRAKNKARKIVDATDWKSKKGDSNPPRSDQLGDSRHSSSLSNHDESDPPGSSSPSEISFDSLVSGGGRTSQADSNRPYPRASDSSRPNASTSSIASKTITADIEPMVGGCLRGDEIAVKVHVNHSKTIRSLYGVILTLYRQARVDMHPSIPLGPTEKGVKDKYEDYYPKSVTGLGGLSLSGAGSSHTFRKDLAQVMVPLYVDPNTLTADVTAKVRVPDEAFPTISTVPGGMISFHYYVEAVVDVQGKLGSSDRPLGSMNAMTGPHAPVLGLQSFPENAAYAPPGTHIIDTAPIRRDKSVISCVFEVIVGTKDSERRKGKRMIEEASPRQGQYELQPASQAPARQTQLGTEDDWLVNDQGYYWDRHPHAYQDEVWHQLWHYDPGYSDQSHYDAPPAVPVPSIPDESQLSEKERMKRAEARLLPSQPPGDEHDAGLNHAQDATAPYLPDESIAGAEFLLASGSAAAAVEPATCSSTAAAADPHSTSHMASRNVEDKQELERQRLNEQASAPPMDDDNEGGPSTSREADAPSAP